MKKFLALLLMAVMTLGLMACGKTEPEVPNTPVPEVEQVAETPEEILASIMIEYEEDEKFPLAGGDYSHIVEETPGKIDVTNGEDLDALFGFPADKVAKIDDGASVMHMMNQNTFTAACYHVTESSEESIAALAEDIKANIENRQWLCGFPDELVIYKAAKDNLVVAFGAEDIINTFEVHLVDVYDAELLHEVNLTF